MSETTGLNSDPQSRAVRPGWLRRYWIAMVLVIAAGAGIAYLVMRAQSPAQQQAATKGKGGPRVTPVGVAAAKLSDVNIYLNGLGTVTPLRNVTVRSRVDGQLMRVLFREGQLVKEGELLAEIDPRPFQVQLTQVEGQAARDEALLANARLDLERYRTLYAQDSIAKQQLDAQESLVRQYEGSIKVDRGQIDNVRLQLTYARITAPVSGRVGLRLVDPGNIVRAGDASGIVVITQVEPINVVFTIPQDNLPQVLARMRGKDAIPVEAFDREQKARLASGHLASIDNQIDPATGTVKLKAEFANRDLALFPNQFVNVRMLIDVQREATVIPASAVLRGARGEFVYVVKGDSTVELRLVKTAVAEANSARVLSGLRPGERVVIDGTDRLRNGAQVEVVGRGADAAKGGDGPREGRRKGKKGKKGKTGAKSEKSEP